MAEAVKARTAFKALLQRRGDAELVQCFASDETIHVSSSRRRPGSSSRAWHWIPAFTGTTVLLGCLRQFSTALADLVRAFLCGLLRLCASAGKDFSLLVGVVMVLSAATSPALAETLNDPTRPAMPGVQASAQSAPVESGTVPQVGVAMVVTAKEGVMALMDGRILRVGSRTEGGVVVQITPDAVFVRSADGKVARLPLYPAVSLQSVSPAPRAASAVRRPDRSKQK